MALFDKAIQQGAVADLPTDNSALTKGRIYFAYDEVRIYFDNGASWDFWDIGSTGGSGGTTQFLTQDAISIPSGAATEVPFELAEGPGSGDFNQSTDTEIGVGGAVAGIYLAEFYVNLDCTALGIGQAAIAVLLVNGTPVSRASTAMDGNTSTQVHGLPKRVTLASSDIITLTIYQSSGGAVDLVSDVADAWSGLNLTLQPS